MTAVCVGRGPSLRPDDLSYCQGKAFVIAINQVVPWADMLYAADWEWWISHPEAHTFTHSKYACEVRNRRPFNTAGLPALTVLKNLGHLGWSDEPSAVYSGGHSGYQAIQVAAHCGATRILLLGYDMHPSGPKPHRFTRWRDTYPVLAEAAKTRGIEIINCSRQTALTVFPCMTIIEAL